ncbi:cytidylate kinase [Andreesenia angusta]|uniref:Cytidylate kinase n=1 Tax=Andreesenia angusta TaxID=39480 RepID=A0A1S1V8L6_9FIRM|nr:(d)CMP kinase [Andreesenia angusta]OHW62961.1 cytidylate kinase [Andreesenia angusta]
MEKYSIAIDGPAGAGKSTISKIVAQKLGLEYIDTGAMYRAVTLKALSTGTDISDSQSVVELLKDTDIDFRENHIYMDERVVDEEIRSSEVNQNVSSVAKIGEIREILVSKQREIANSKSVIMDGRDIGTTVLSDAEYKFYLNASVEERARRRYEEDKSSQSYEEIKRDIEKRDEIDMNREISPLVKAEDAVEVDTTDMDIEEVVDFIVGRVRGGKK